MQDVSTPGPAKMATTEATPVAAPTSTSFLRRWMNAFTNTGLPCPETAEMLSKHARDIQAVPLMNNGFKFAVMAQLGTNCQHVHTFNLGTAKEQRYSMQAVYFEEFKNKKGDSNGGSLVMTGDIDTEGNLQGTLQFHPQKNTKIGVQMGMTAQNIYLYDFEHKGADYNFALRMIPNLLKGQNEVTGSYMQSITQKLAMGVEGVYDVFSDPPPHTWRDLNLSWLTHYRGSDWAASGRVGANGAQLAYSRRVSPKTSMSTECAIDARMNSTWNIAYTLEFRFGKVRGQIDTSGAVHGVLEKPLGFGTFILSGTTQGLSQPAQKFGAAFVI